MDHYARLNIESDAAKIDIKRAYFKLVKQYPPENYPEEFKAYRKAYEVLYNNDTRAEYDRTYQLLPIEKSFLDEANKYIQMGDFEYAIDILKEAKSKIPQKVIYDELLGEVYLLSGHTGNAVKIYQELALQEPSNTVYQRRLGDAYRERGFTKKAIAQYEHSIELAPEHIGNWLGLGECYLNGWESEQVWSVFERGTPYFSEYGPDSLKFHLAILFFSIRTQKEDSYTKALEWIKHCLHQDSALAKELLEDIDRWDGSRAIETRWTAEAFYRLYQFLLELVPDNEHIAKSCEELQLIWEVFAIDEDERLQLQIAALTDNLDRNCGCPHCEIERGILELEILGNLPDSRKELRILKAEYPKQYEKNKVFYSQVLDPRKEQRLLDQTIRKLSRLVKKNPLEYEEVLEELFMPPDMIRLLNEMLGVDAGIGDEYEMGEWDEPVITQPFIRESPKIGRNDPCPCGSGKKYKKCCGA